MSLTDNQQLITDKLIVVCGPTATGKTAYALKLAKKLNGELVSADSRQLYKYMDIGTGKDLPANSKFKIRNLKLTDNRQPTTNNHTIGYYTINEIKLWLYDVITPNQRFSAYEYATIARIVINNIIKLGKQPIVVGGTGFYIKALLSGFDTEGVPADWKLREKLGKYEIGKLQQEFQKVNPNKFKQMNHSDQNNPRRLVRAIEVAVFNQSKNQSINISNEQKNKSIKILLKTIMCGLTIPKTTLYKQIDKRVEQRVKQGMINEIKKLLKMGYAWDDPGLQTIGYKEWKPYFEKKAKKEEVIQRWKLNEHSYARRQLTWFKKQKGN